MQQTKKIVIVAGEESGDSHAAVLIKQLKVRFSDIDISGIGGQHMRNAGAHLIYDLARYGVTGFTEVVRSIHIVFKAFSAIKTHLKEKKPDLLILVDYPGFNLRLAKYAKRELGIKIIYYISPQIWAWKGQRIHLIKECVDQMAVIFPFEKEIYEKAQVPVAFVGHPLVEKMPSEVNTIASKIRLNIPLDPTVIAFLPGSRRNEIEKHLPVLRDTALLLNKKLDNLHFVLPIAETVNSEHIKKYFSNSTISITYIQGNALECMMASDFVIVASGTASLECALLEKPMCIIYKSSVLTYLAAIKLLKVKFIGLCNLLAKKMIVPEFLQYDCNAEELSRYIVSAQQSDRSQKMIILLAKLKESLSSNKADCSLFDLIEAELS